MSRQTVKLTLSSSVALESRYTSFPVEKRPDRPHIPSNIQQCQKAEERKTRKLRHSSDAPSGRSFPDCLQNRTFQRRVPSRSDRPVVSVSGYLGRPPGTRKRQNSKK
ncbi:hypothetical protein Pden_1973 [Paracoccus denitrificans PD1222]|uniref:Uncharacterized protein n=1 Tax=Paracoccus denitrificans (strain Pd 1222) TaxID=318586 RepID=A1B3H1_PARDP|nr:hypothetical protein Pden_1973 [Paracoccus denitrificans PD1222]